jgi:hypothetical protein
MTAGRLGRVGVAEIRRFYERARRRDGTRVVADQSLTGRRLRPAGRP